MRALLAVLVLAGCSAVPPEPVVPLDGGVGAYGVTLDVPVRGPGTGGLSFWGGVGLGRGVDVAASVDAPVTLVANLGRIGRDGGVFAPPGLMVRKTFESDLGVGLGTAAAAEVFVESTGTGFHRMAVGPFVTVGGRGGDGLAGRASAHLVYRIDSDRGDEPGRRGWDAYGVASLGVVRPTPRVLVGARAVGRLGLGGHAGAGVAVGPFVTGLGEN